MISEELTSIKKPERKFVPNDINFDNWAEIKPLLDYLVDAKISTENDLLEWMFNRSELDAAIEEDVAWRYIKMTIDTRVEALAKHYEFFVSEINPKISPYEDLLNKKLNSCPFKNNIVLDGVNIYLREVENDIALFRETNIPLQATDAQLSQKYGSISGKQSIVYKGEELTMQAAGVLLKSADRGVRKEVFELVNKRRLEDKEELDALYLQMIANRTRIAKNAGFENYRDYKFKALGRFDYQVEDCVNFHEAIKQHVIPVTKAFAVNHKEQLQVDPLKPYDTEVDPLGRNPLRPFKNGAGLLMAVKEIFAAIDPYFADCLSVMEQLGHLDLESKAGKAPGGYNYPLYEIGVPFIFMNSVGLHRDFVTMIHEGGHAVHSFLSRTLSLTSFKSTPSEVAELASMGMELITMEHWDIVYSGEELIRAKKEQLEGVLKILPWVATVDKFQHWVYTHPEAGKDELYENWEVIQNEFSNGVVDWQGYEAFKNAAWQRQLHIFEVPFYYIEYGMAQLGAIALWRNYRLNPDQTIAQYKSALSLGYTRTIGELYEAAGIKFSFTSDYVSELMTYIDGVLEDLK